MNKFRTYVYDNVKFTNSLTKLASIKYKLDVLSEFTKNINPFEDVDQVTIFAAESLGLLNEDIANYKSGSSVIIGMEEVIKSVSQAILKYVNQITKGFSDLSESFCSYQKDLINTTNQAFNILSKTYENSDYKNIIIKQDIPNFHEFKVLSQCMLLFMRSTFQNKLQNVVGEESLFGLKSKESFISYDEIIPSELTTSLQTKLGLSYERNSKEEDDATHGNSNMEILRFTQPFKIPFETKSYNDKTIERLGYGNISDLKKFTESLNKSILALVDSLPKLSDKCKTANTLTQQYINSSNDGLTEDDAKNVVDTAMVWGNMTEACLKCITFYMRAYQEILNVLYTSIKEQSK